MVLHYANLCVQAGGVSSFLIGSELRGLTTTRDQAGAFPAVEELKILASEARAILGAQTDISYGADWSEYFGFQPADGSNDVFFHLDDLWADGNIDFIGIDNYMPLADWRDGSSHLDALSGTRSIYEAPYLQANIEGGEGYDWYYASAADRSAQTRTPIVDGAYGEPWVFKYKDIRNWWENTHHDRPGGVKALSATPWQAQMKPVRFTELGCGAVDKAANQPNVFADPKSAENAKPYFSNGQRDDLMARRFLEAHLAYWQDVSHNPVSTLYGAPMLDTDRLYVYTWDARPFPAFPALTDVWADSANWHTGHWLNGRAGRVPLDLLVKDIAVNSGILRVDVSALQGLVTGFVIDRPMAAREALEPLAGLYQFDPVESGDVLKFVPRGGAPVLNLETDGFVVEQGEPFSLTKAQASDLPVAFDLVYLDDGQTYDRTVAEARRPDALGLRMIGLETPVILETGEAEGRADALLADAIAMAESASFSVPPSLLALEPTDSVAIEFGAVERQFRLLDILDGDARDLACVMTNQSLYDVRYGAARSSTSDAPVVYGPPVLDLLDIPLLDDRQNPAVYAAAYAAPWPGGISLYRQADEGTPSLEEVLQQPAIIGRLVNDLMPGPEALWDCGQQY